MDSKMKYVAIMIPKPKNTIDEYETVVTTDGVVYQIPYGRRVEVPRNVAEVIEQNRSLQAKIKDLLINNT